ncbi:MAG: Zn(II)2Cys6 transcription factor domain-containing protein, partial [archaeon]|nr:Zn(II)2Cys6 transcription factor domain-containing protein [archaeon]
MTSVESARRDGPPSPSPSATPHVMEKKRLVRPEDGQGWEACSKKQRPSKRSCEGCAKGHQSCDKTRPQCGNCQRKRKACAYDDACAPVVALQPRPASDQSELVRQQRELIEQQQALIEHLKQVLTTPSIPPTSRSNSRPSLHQTSTHTTSPPPPPPSAVVLPTNFPSLQLAWDPNEGELHSL